MRLDANLALVGFISDLLGSTPSDLVDSLSRADEGRRPDGQSNFYGRFESERSRLNLDLDDLKRYDLNILSHEKALASHRAGFRLKYFQYLAALFTEIYLDRLTKDAPQLLLDVEAYRAAHFPDLPSYTADDLRKLAFFMATGAGKTLVMHINMRQFLHYKPFDPATIIVLTPTETLARQHLRDLRESGISASYALDAVSGYRDVQVIEIQKLYVDRGMTAPKSGVSLPTSQFSGRNLLLVDEGHKGTATKSEKETERAWRDIREALVGERGFTLEYSATFAQVTENDDALFNEYARTIVFEYAYRRFHEHNYGKDYRIFNLKKHDELYGDTLLMAGLLAFYEKRRYYDDHGAEIAPYLIEAPLLVFVGAQVTSGPEVLAVVRFLDRLLRDTAWVTETIGNILRGESGLPGRGDQDPFANAFLYLKELGLTPDAFYTDLCRRILRGVGRLSLHRLRRADGEIGLRTADSAQEAYCGVVNVGAASGFLRKVRAETLITVGDDDHIVGSLFDAINDPGSQVNVLVGSKKFIEGWSSWRVSVMGLLKVGTNASAQVLQLFGRGVRLKGRDMSLKRSLTGSGTHPRHIQLLETLHIFGLKSDYLDNFLRDLEREGITQPEIRYLLLDVPLDVLARAELKALEVDPKHQFANQVVAFDPDKVKVSLDLNPRLVRVDSDSTDATSTRHVAKILPEATRALLPYEALFDYALSFKRQKAWENIYISRDAVKRIFERSATLAAPPDILMPTRPEHLRTLERAAEALLKSGLERFQYLSQQRFETAHLRTSTLAWNHANFPRLDREQPVAYAYELRVPPSLLTAVEAIISNATERLKESTAQPLPRLYVDVHLFNPLLLLPQVKGVPAIKSIPTGLEPSEQQFAEDLRAFWQTVASNPDWDECELYLLRNLPKIGVGFFETAGFYPDFLLWLKRGDRQALGFIDPKGLVHWNEEKVSLLQYIRDQSTIVGIKMVAYIVTPTEEASLQIPGVSSTERLVYLKQRYVLHQQNPMYIQTILEEMREHITKPE